MVKEVQAKVGTHSTEIVKVDERYRIDVVENVIRVKRQGQKWQMMRIWKINRETGFLYLEL